jgi:hypothetical protein
VFFGGREDGSRLRDDPAITAIRPAWAWVRSQASLPATWRWRLALGRAPWWIGMFAVLVATLAMAASSLLGTLVPSGRGAASELVAIPGMIVGLLLLVPLYAAIAVAVPVVLSGLVLLLGTQWFTDGVVLHGGDASGWLRLRARLWHVGFDVALIALMFVPAFLVVPRDGTGAWALLAWLLLPPMLVGRVLYVSVVAAGGGSTSGLARTAWLVVRRPFAVARVLVVQGVGALGIAVLAVPLFGIVGVVASPAWVLAIAVHVAAWLAGAPLPAHAVIAVGELCLYVIGCAVLVGRVTAPLLLWHTRHRVLAVQELLSLAA